MYDSIWNLFTWFIFACTISAVLRSLIAKLNYERKKYPDGPWSLGFLGNVFTLSRLHSNPDQELLSLADRYGDICMLWFGSTPVIVINTPRAARDLLTERGALYASRPEHNTFRAEMWPWRLVTTSTGETFRFLRKLYHSLLNPQQSSLFRKYQHYEANVLLCDLLDRPEDFLQETERFAMSVIFSATYGVRIADLNHGMMREFYSIWDSCLRYFQPGSLPVDFIPALQMLPDIFQPWKSLARSLRAREASLHLALFQTLVKSAKAGEAPDCFGKRLVEVQAKDGIGDEQAVDILAMLIGAGADTTSSVLQSFFKIMALHPDVVEKAQKELDTVVGTTRLPGWDDECSLPYIRALIKEVHRWGPIGSLGIPHAVTQDDVYNGRLLQKGTIVFPNLTALSRDPNRYLEPNVFNPDRFLGDSLDSSASALSPDYRDRDHFHYGLGRRLCQGIFVAEASLYIVISRILWGFNIEAKPGHELNMDAKIAGLVTKPKPFQVAIESRDPAHTVLIRDALERSQTNVLDFDAVFKGQTSAARR